MDGTLKNMDISLMNNLCVWLEKVLAWVERCGLPPIVYIGIAPEGYRNPPAPLLEIAYLLDHEITDLSVGDKVVSIPPYHVTLLNVHQGNFTPTLQRFESWCLIMDVGRDPEFAALKKEPLFCAAPLPLNREVLAAFEHLGRLCVRYRTPGWLASYGGPSYDPAVGRSSKPVGVQRIKGAMLDLFGLLLEVLGPASQRPPHPPPVHRAIEYMSLRYRNPSLRLPEVARAAGLSQQHLGRLFHESLGESPMQHLKTLRLQHARYLLESSSLGVAEVASAVGYEDPLHFSRAFRAFTGKSPRAWRKGEKVGGAREAKGY